MDIQIKQGPQCHTSNCYTYRNGDIKYIVIHFTSNNGDTALNNCNYFSGANRGASAHYFIGDDGIYQSVPDKWAAWAVGGTKIYKHPYCRNMNSISIEMCSRIGADGKYYIRDGIVEQTIKLTRYLMNKYNVPVENVLRHYDVWDKKCPAQWATENSAGWTTFKEKVKAILRNEEGLTVSQYEELIEKIKELDNKKADKSEMIYDCIDHNMPEWAHKPVQWCLDNGIVSGTDDAHLALNNTKLWVCVVVYRAVKFVAGLMKIKI